MLNQKDRSTAYKYNDKEKEFSKTIHHWLAQYEEEDDFLCGKVSNSLAEFTEDE